MDITLADYNGKVYCVEVPNHILLVRRKGTPYFCGNTLPILEAMACGIPVLTRSLGHVPDLYNGKNMVIRNGEQNDIEDLKINIKQLMENREQRLKIRNYAWDTVKNRDDRSMAHVINRMYYSIYEKELELFSIIIPTKDNPEAFIESLLGAINQTYTKKEIIVVDSGNTSIKKIIDEAKKSVPVTIKYIKFNHNNTYSLAEARNRGIIESDGKYIVFCDDRLKMEPDALFHFNIHKKNNTWLWGVKDDSPKGFVENFSCVGRRELITGGMFCERMQWYGGMTQEIRARFEKEKGLDFILIPEAKAKSVKRAKSRKSRRNDIINAKHLIYKMYGK